MTAPDMNAPIRKFAAVFSAVAAAAGLTACVAVFNPETDPTSPVAPRVQTLVEANRGYPRWTDFPKSVEAPPEPTQIAERVAGLAAAGDHLAEAAARIEWAASGDADAFAEAVRARVTAVPVAPVTQQTAAEIEEFARRIRERGHAPPPIPRR
jgi:hypothetical protein